MQYAHPKIMRYAHADPAKPQLRFWHCFQAAILESAVLLMSYLAFFYHDSYEFWLLPLLILAALRFGFSGALMCFLTILIMATLSTIFGYGTFDRLFIQYSLVSQYFHLSIYAFLVLTMIGSLCLVRVLTRCKQSDAKLEQLFLNRHTQLEAVNQDPSRSDVKVDRIETIDASGSYEKVRVDAAHVVWPVCG